MSSLAVWSLVMIGVVVFYPMYRRYEIERRLDAVGLVPAPPPGRIGVGFAQNGMLVKDATDFWRAAGELADHSPAVTGLNLSAYKGTLTLQGMPTLPKLQSLDVRCDKLTTLQDMPMLPALNKIDLQDTSVTDISPLRRMPKLKQIGVTQGQRARLQGPPQLRAKLVVSPSQDSQRASQLCRLLAP